MDLREVFAANLRRLRNAKGVSQDELAYEANVSRSYLSQLEKGTFYASLNVIGRLSDALGGQSRGSTDPAPRRARAVPAT
jgi:transcriptional regulator with XRE-family HTH domain